MQHKTQWILHTTHLNVRDLMVHPHYVTPSGAAAINLACTATPSQEPGPKSRRAMSGRIKLPTRLMSSGTRAIDELLLLPKACSCPPFHAQCNHYITCCSNLPHSNSQGTLWSHLADKEYAIQIQFLFPSDRGALFLPYLVFLPSLRYPHTRIK